LKDTTTGEEATHEYEITPERADDPDDCEGFYWTDGNGACDCNRVQFFKGALGDTGDGALCSNGRIVIVEATVDGVTRDWK